MFAQPVAGTLDVDDDGVVEQPVQQGGRDHGIAEDLPPFGKAAIGGQNHGAAFVAGVDQLEEQVACPRADTEVADLIDDQQRRSAEIADALAQASFAFGTGEAVDDIGERGEVDAAARADRLELRARSPDDSSRCRTGR